MIWKCEYCAEPNEAKDKTKNAVCKSCNKVNKNIEMIDNRMTLSEFKEKYYKGNKTWNFSLFKITCNKCGSNNVEFSGELELEIGSGYYDDEIEKSGSVIVKCHDCGNALVMDCYDLEKK